MLCLSRKERQVVEIRHGGEVLRVIVWQVLGITVRLAFDAPPSFEIMRDDARKRGPGR